MFLILKIVLIILLNQVYPHIAQDVETTLLPTRNLTKKLTVELAVFFDEAAYRAFMPFLDNDKDKLRNIILMYVNSIQAAFHDPSFGASLIFYWYDWILWKNNRQICQFLTTILKNCSIRSAIIRKL